jgi:ribosomal protein L32
MASFLSGNATPATVLIFSLSPVTKPLHKYAMQRAMVRSNVCTDFGVEELRNRVTSQMTPHTNREEACFVIQCF